MGSLQNPGAKAVLAKASRKVAKMAHAKERERETGETGRKAGSDEPF